MRFTHLTLNIVAGTMILVTSYGHAQVKTNEKKTQVIYNELAKMRTEYISKDANNARFARFDEQRREAHRIVVKDCLAFHPQGQPVADTSNNKGDRANYVMDAAGNIYLFDQYINPSIRHSSIFPGTRESGGEPVAGAGEITIKNQRIVYVDANSGHYPARAVLGQVKQELNRNGCDLN